MFKYIFSIVLILLNFYSHAGENKCSKCYKSCINKPNYNILDSEEVIKFLKEGKLSIIKDQDNILSNSDKTFLKNNSINFYSFIFFSALFDNKQARKKERQEQQQKRKRSRD